LAWNYQDVATDLRRPNAVRTQTPQDQLPRQNVRPALRVVGSDE
jgi:hypothetical protein